MFKRLKKKPNLRNPIPQDEIKEEHTEEEAAVDNEEDDILAKLNEIKERQKARERPRGIDVGELNAGLKLYPEPEEEQVVDPFKTMTGGLVDRNTLKKRCDKSDDAYDTGIGTSFSAETNLRDEDDEMRRFIDGELAKRTGKSEESKEEDSKNQDLRFLSPEDAALRAIPEELKSIKSSWSEKSEEMLSSQMLSGIPEIDLGMEAKIKNIEATESAKNRILAERLKKKDTPSEFVPTNMAVNFVQHNRYNLEESNSNKRNRNKPDQQRPQLPFEKPQQPQRKRAPEQKVVVGVDGEAALVSEPRMPRRPGEERATDDFAYEKFKKQFKKH